MADKTTPVLTKAAFLHSVRDRLRKVGIDVQRVSPRSDPIRRLAAVLKMHGIDYVLDVGANRGQFTMELFAAGFGGTVLSFEPLPQVHDSLSKAAAAYGGRWQVGPRVALGDEEADVTFYLAANTASSSLLKLSEDLVDIAPQTAPSGTINVRVRRLDQILSELGLTARRLFLKMDTQGSELRILQGAEGALGAIQGVMTEMSVSTLYEDQPLFRDIDGYLVDHGFDLVDLVPGFRDPVSLRLLQFDGVYLKGAR